MNFIKDNRRGASEWAIYPAEDSQEPGGVVCGHPWETEFRVENGGRADPRVSLVLEDPRVGGRAIWDPECRYVGKIRAIVVVDGVEESLLVEDFTGYPWIRCRLDVEIA